MAQVWNQFSGWTVSTPTTDTSSLTGSSLTSANFSNDLYWVDDPDNDAIDDGVPDNNLQDADFSNTLTNQGDPTTDAPGEGVASADGGTPARLIELGQFNNSTINLADGGTYTINVFTFRLDNDTVVFRFRDADIDAFEAAGFDRFDIASITLSDEYFTKTQFNYTRFNQDVACFTAGTMIDTSQGPRAVEDLEPGDLVRTMDHGLKPICWVGSKQVPAKGDVAPIRFDTGTIGNTEPLLVSPQHRVLLRDSLSHLLFGESEVLVAATHLVNGTTIRRVTGGDVHYVHIMFDCHEIVFANGAPTESFFPGDIGLTALGGETQRELFRLFPQLASKAGNYKETARMCLTGHENRLLAQYAQASI